MADIAQSSATTQQPLQLATTPPIVCQPPPPPSTPPPDAAEERKKRSHGWVSTTNPNVYWRSRPSREPVNALGLPLPPIRARSRRPHAIHIIAYPSGFVPYDLRPGYNNAAKAAAAAAAATTAASAASAERSRSHSRSPSRGPWLSWPHDQQPTSRKIEKKRKSLRRAGSAPVGESWAKTGFGKFLAPFYTSQTQQTQPQQHQGQHPDTTTNRPTTRSSEATTQIRLAEDVLGVPTSESMSRPLSMVEAMIAGQSPATYMALARGASKPSVSSNVVELSTPVAAGSGVTCSIILAEPNIYLAGFDHDSRRRQGAQAGTSLLRGRLHLDVTKDVKIKAVTLKLVGKARTEWPEGIPPAKQVTFEEEALRTQVLTFFNAMHDGWETSYGNQCTYRLKSSTPASSLGNGAQLSPRSFFLGSDSNNGISVATAAASAAATASFLVPLERASAANGRRMSVATMQPRASLAKPDSVVSTTQLKGYRVFHPGTFDYTFELPIDHHQLETAKLQFGSVRWELQAVIERAGPFKPNLHGSREVSVVRVPDQLSLETTEPISISRRWEDQLHYEIVISGKSFPIGGRIPIAFKLTPLAKVQIHKLKVYVSETVEYWTNDRRVTRRDPGRKILLLEKSAGMPLDDAYLASDLNVVSGGELGPAERSRARRSLARPQAQGQQRLPEPADNLLGDLDLGEMFWGATEIEANIQMPTCEMMARNKDLRLSPDCTWKNVNVYHWIKVVLRLSRLDPDDPTCTRRRHFEISIDSPFTVLNCKATQANLGLPQYSDVLSGRASPPTTHRTVCGCPDSALIASEHMSTDSLNPHLDMPAPPQAAHFPSSPTASNPFDATPAPGYTESASHEFRPMHLLRAPSYHPPPFDADVAPPPIEIVVPSIPSTSASADGEAAMSPPPLYDVVVGTPSHDGLADYFSRLADHGFDTADAEEDDDSDVTEDDDSSRPPLVERRSGRVNVSNPRTPGPLRAPSRSLDLQRPSFRLSLPNAASARSRGNSRNVSWKGLSRFFSSALRKWRGRTRNRA